MSRIASLAVVAGLSGSTAFAQGADLEKRVSQLEFASMQNGVSFGGTFESRYDHMTLKPNVGKEQTLNVNRMRLGLDFKASPTDDLTFFGRLQMSNVYNDQQSQAVTDTRGRSYESSVAYVERAFVNYSIMKGLTLSMGRLPTLDGPPMQFYDNLSRQGAYPKLAYSSALDGYALTYAMAPTTTSSLSLRFVHSPMSRLTHIPAEGATTYSSYGLSTRANGSLGDNVPMNSAMIDYSLVGASFAKEFNVILQGVDFTGYRLADSIPVGTDLSATQNLPAGTLVAQGSTLEFAYQAMVAHVEMNDIASTGVSLFVSNMQTTVKSKGLMDPGAMPVGMGTNAASGTAKGSATLAGLSYRLPVDAMKNPSIGFESLSSDKNYTHFEFSEYHPLSFYSTRGSASHVFYSQPLNQNTKLRIGMLDLKPTHSPTLMGEPTKTKDTYQSVYAQLRADF